MSGRLDPWPMPSGSWSTRLLYGGKNLDGEKQSCRLCGQFWKERKFLRKVSRIPGFPGECSGRTQGLFPETGVLVSALTLTMQLL